MPSPERQQHVHRVPGQRPPLEKRLSPAGIVVQNWDQMNGIILESFRDRPDLLDFYKANKKFYNSFFEARSDIANKRGSERFNRFLAKYDDDRSKYFALDRFETGRPILDRINLSLFPNRVFVKR